MAITTALFVSLQVQAGWLVLALRKAGGCSLPKAHPSPGLVVQAGCWHVCQSIYMWLPYNMAAEFKGEHQEEGIGRSHVTVADLTLEGTLSLPQWSFTLVTSKEGPPQFKGRKNRLHLFLGAVAPEKHVELEIQLCAFLDLQSAPESTVQDVQRALGAARLTVDCLVQL